MWSKTVLDEIARTTLPATVIAGSLADLTRVLEKRVPSGVLAGSLADLLNAIEKRALSSPQAGSLAALIQGINTLAAGIPNAAQASIYNAALATLISTNLNKPISQVADGATVWTQAVRDQILARLDVTVGSVAAAAAAAVWATATKAVTAIPSVIRSIQHIDTVTVNSAVGTYGVTIASVTVAKAVIINRTMRDTCAFTLDFSGSPTSVLVNVAKTVGALQLSFSVMEYI